MTSYLTPEPPLDFDGAPRRPEFSVVIPAYEAEATLGEAIQSALDQTYAAAEIVVCDDGSSDDTSRVAGAFGDGVILLRQENRGVAAARNTGVAKASGDFIVNLDADDLLSPRNLEARAGLITQRPDLDIVVTDGTVELDGQTRRHLYNSSWEFETEDQRSEILERCFIAPFWALRRSALLAAGGFDESISHSSDWECFIRLILRGSRAGLVDEPLGSYRLQRGSLSNQAAGLARGQIKALQRAVEGAELTPAETDAVRAKIDEFETQLALALLREAVLAGDPATRERARRVFGDSGMPAMTRAKAALSWALPSLARRMIARQGSQTGAGIIIPAD